MEFAEGDVVAVIGGTGAVVGLAVAEFEEVFGDDPVERGGVGIDVEGADEGGVVGDVGQAGNLADAGESDGVFDDDLVAPDVDAGVAGAGCGKRDVGFEAWIAPIVVGGDAGGGRGGVEDGAVDGGTGAFRGTMGAGKGRAHEFEPSAGPGGRPAEQAGVEGGGAVGAEADSQATEGDVLGVLAVGGPGHGDRGLQKRAVIHPLPSGNRGSGRGG